MAIRLGTAALGVLLSGTALGADAGPTANAASWHLAAGTTRLHLREWVFMHMAPWNVSRLDWTATAPTLSAGLEVPLPGGASFGLDIETLLRHGASMTDKDWMPPNFVDFSSSNWTHQSWHDDTTMSGLAALAAHLAQRVDLGGPASLGLKASLGLRQLAVEARGGTGTYSNDNGQGFRTRTPSFVPGDKTISIDHVAISALLGADLQIKSGPFSLTLEGAGGVSVQKFRDRHWLRDFYMEGWLQPAPVLTAGVTASYDLSDTLTAFLSARYERVFTTHGNRIDRKLSDKSWLGDYSNSLGLESESLSVRLGLNGTFEGTPRANPAPPALESGAAGALAWTADMGATVLDNWEFVAPGQGVNTRAQATNWAAVTPLFTLMGSADLGGGWRLAARAGAALPATAQSRQVELDSSFYSLHFNGRDFGTVNFAVDHTDKAAKLLGYLDGGLTVSRSLLRWNGVDLSLTGTLALDHIQYESHLRPSANLPATGTISYALTTPRLLAGLALSAQPFGWDVTLDTATGVALGVTGTRRDSFRDQRVETQLEPQPVVSVESAASRELLPGLTAFVKGGLEVRFLTRGREEDYTLSGQSLGQSDGGAGGFFAKAALSAGIKGSF